MAFSTSGSNSISADINVTPLIDVLLVLLILFMVIVPLTPVGLGTTLPALGDTRSATASAERPILVQVDGDSTQTSYRIDGESVALDGLPGRLKALLATRSERQMLIQADPRLEFGTVSRVVDAGRAAGAETVGLITAKRVF